jgi:nicotinamidase-related amidase
MKEAIVVLDMTRDSIAPDARVIEKRRALLPNAARFLAWCSARRKTDKWFRKYWEFVNEIWKPGQEPIPELFDKENDHIVHKRRYSGFFASDLDVTLRELDVDSLLLMGWSTALAVATTAIDAWQHGYSTSVVQDLTVSHAFGGYSVDETQQWSIKFIEAMAKSRIVSSTELMK